MILMTNRCSVDFTTEDELAEFREIFNLVDRVSFGPTTLIV